jgi:hypothetical protein
MKFLFNITTFVFSIALFAQKNYIIEYDKLNDKTKYYECDWVHGAQQKKEVKSFSLNNHDVVIIQVINLNNFVYDLKVTRDFTELEASRTPVANVIRAFTPFGGPALSLLTSLSGNLSSNYRTTTRDGQPSSPSKIKTSELLTEGTTLIKNLTQNLNSYKNVAKVKYSKTKTKEEILAELKYNYEKMSTSNNDEIIARLDSINNQLEKITEEIDPNDEFWVDVDKYVQAYTTFEENFLDDKGNLMAGDLGGDIREFEKSDFKWEDRFLAASKNDYREFSSNTFILMFKEKNINGEPTVEMTRNFEIPINQPKLPNWALGINAVAPIGGINEYEISEISGSYVFDTPDSLSINEVSKNGLQLAIGTQLCFDINTKSKIQPSVTTGFALGGLNKDRSEWNINFLLGGALSFKKIPFINLNAGLSLTQVKVLRQEFPVNRTFVKPAEFNGYDPDLSILFKKVLRPGLFFGVSLKL